MLFKHLVLLYLLLMENLLASNFVFFSFRPFCFCFSSQNCTHYLSLFIFCFFFCILLYQLVFIFQLKNIENDVFFFVRVQCSLYICAYVFARLKRIKNTIISYFIEFKICKLFAIESV